MKEFSQGVSSAQGNTLKCGLIWRRFLGHLVREFSQGLYTGRVMYHAFLRPLSRNALSLMADVDRRAPPPLMSCPAPQPLHCLPCWIGWLLMHLSPGADHWSVINKRP